MSTFHFLFSLYYFVSFWEECDLFYKKEKANGRLRRHERNDWTTINYCARSSLFGRQDKVWSSKFYLYTKGIIQGFLTALSRWKRKCASLPPQQSITNHIQLYFDNNDYFLLWLNKRLFSKWKYSKNMARFLSLNALQRPSNSNCTKYESISRTFIFVHFASNSCLLCGYFASKKRQFWIWCNLKW